MIGAEFGEREKEQKREREKGKAAELERSIQAERTNKNMISHKNNCHAGTSEGRFYGGCYHDITHPKKFHAGTSEGRFFVDDIMISHKNRCNC